MWDFLNELFAKRFPDPNEPGMFDTVAGKAAFIIVMFAIFVIMPIGIYFSNRIPPPKINYKKENKKLIRQLRKTKRELDKFKN